MRISCTLALAGLIMSSSLTPIHSERNVKRLTTAHLAKAREFIMGQARPLEQALYSFRFERGSADAVREALRDFQNPDGGFGQALEPDLLAPESSALATIRALQTLTALHTPPDHPMIRQAMAYLASTFNETNGVWRIIPPTADAHPHAPWWNQEQLDQTFGGFRILPRAEILGYLFTFDAPSFPPDRRLALLDGLLQILGTTPDSASGGAVDSCARLLQAGRVPAGYRERLYEKLVPLVPRAVEQNPEKWKEYCLKPTWLVRTPESPFLHLIAESVERNLDYEIDNQCDDGSWSPNWSWFGTYPETWPVAEKEWRGILTIQTLETLQAFGRIERQNGATKRGE